MTTSFWDKFGFQRTGCDVVLRPGLIPSVRAAAANSTLSLLSCCFDLGSENKLWYHLRLEDKAVHERPGVQAASNSLLAWESLPRDSPCWGYSNRSVAGKVFSNIRTFIIPTHLAHSKVLVFIGASCPMTRFC